MGSLVEFESAVDVGLKSSVVGICGRFHNKVAVDSDHYINVSNNFVGNIHNKVSGRCILAEPFNAVPHLKLSILPHIKGNIVLIERGLISFVQKYEFAIKAGAVAVIIANNDTANPDSVVLPTGTINNLPMIKIMQSMIFPPIIMISYNSCEKIKQCFKASPNSKINVTISPINSTYELDTLTNLELGICARGCCIFGYEELLSKIIKEGKKRDEASENSNNLLEILRDEDIDRGANLLHVACENRYGIIVAMLLRYGFDTSTVKNDGYCPLHISCELGDVECVSLLARTAYLDQTHPVGWTPMHICCKYNYIELLELLILNGANLNPQAVDYCTPLHIAVIHNSDDCLVKLLQAGANYKYRNLKGLTALDMALYTSKINTIQIISSHINNDIVPASPTTYNILIPLGIKENDNIKIINVKNDLSQLGDSWNIILRRISLHCKLPLIKEFTDYSAHISPEILPLIQLDLDRCCYVSYRSKDGIRRRILYQSAVYLISNHADCNDRPVISYRQGFLSLLAVMVESFMMHNISDSINLEVVDEKCVNDLVEKVTNLFYSVLKIFPILGKYFCSYQTGDPLETIFHNAMKLLGYWCPKICANLIWNGIEPNLFAVSWVTTLLADLLSIENAIYFWDIMITSIEVMIANNTISSGDDYLEALIVSLIAQYSGSIVYANSDFNCQQDSSGSLSPASRSPTANSFENTQNSEESIDDNPLFPTIYTEDSASVDYDPRIDDTLASMEDLLLLFASINNPDIYHDNNTPEKQGKRNRIIPINLPQLINGINWIIKHNIKAITKHANLLDAKSKELGGLIWQNLGNSIPSVTLHDLISEFNGNPIIVINMDNNNSSIKEQLINCIKFLKIVEYRELRVDGMLSFYRQKSLVLSGNKKHFNSSIKKWSGCMCDMISRIPQLPSTCVKELVCFKDPTFVILTNIDNKNGKTILLITYTIHIYFYIPIFYRYTWLRHWVLTYHLWIWQSDDSCVKIN